MDRSTSFIDQLGIIGGNLGLCVGMSVLGMFEAMTFVLIVVKSSIEDIRAMWRTILSYFGFNVPDTTQEDTPKKLVVFKGAGVQNINEDNGYEESQEDLKKLYVRTYLRHHDFDLISGGV